MVSKQIWYIYENYISLSSCKLTSDRLYPYWTILNNILIRLHTYCTNNFKQHFNIKVFKEQYGVKPNNTCLLWHCSCFSAIFPAWEFVFLSSLELLDQSMDLSPLYLPRKGKQNRNKNPLRALDSWFLYM